MFWRSLFVLLYFFLLAIMLFVLLRYMVSDYLPLEYSNSSWYKFVNDFSSLFMPFVVHKIPWFDWTNKNHENWYSTKNNEFTIHRKFHEFLMHNSWGLVHITKPWIDISNLWPEKCVCFVQFCDCCLMPTQQFFSYIMARTSSFFNEMMMRSSFVLD
jgi:hypothetical protein